LLSTIASLPHGAVVLPGLDTDLDGTSWGMIAGKDEIAPAAGHPQFAMQALLRRIGIARDEVVRLAEPAANGPELIASEAVRPAATTELWRARTGDDSFAERATRALDRLTLIEAANSEEEALAIAIALREVLDEPGKTAALVTPDRALARRVLA